ncbi:hypothetical protein EI42_04078 [Thermosporothrix hazakensis]|uniref:Uncharacterized protein n=1 Tax=Thermosporothrix hazakensis TaxID=644383 RepID=A0A326UFW9_THEHA|nr:hypothetical protein EI42_04078 [Thermosporothrix hazakensis]
MAASSTAFFLLIALEQYLEGQHIKLWLLGQISGLSFPGGLAILEVLGPPTAGASENACIVQLLKNQALSALRDMLYVRAARTRRRPLCPARSLPQQPLDAAE